MHYKKFKRLPAEMVYPSDYIIQHAERQVRRVLGAATAAGNPCPSDDDIEYLSCAFIILNLHHLLPGLAELFIRLDAHDRADAVAKMLAGA